MRRIKTYKETKNIVLIVLGLFYGCSPTPAQNLSLINALNDTTITIKGEIIEYEKNNYWFNYYDVFEVDTHVAFLNSKNYQGGGPSWLGIVYGAIKLSDPALLNKIDFQEEGEGLSIASADKETLLKIGRLIAVVKSDEEVMLEAIQAAEKDRMME